MIEKVVPVLVAREQLVSQTDFSTKTAHCHIPYCPASITICCMNIEDENCYYISYIPHFHNTSVHNGSPVHFTPILQAIHYVQSALTYFDNWLSLHHSSSSSTLLQRMMERNRVNFVEECNARYRSFAMRDLGEEQYEKVAKMTSGMDGK